MNRKIYLVYILISLVLAILSQFIISGNLATSYENLLWEEKLKVAKILMSSPRGNDALYDSTGHKIDSAALAINNWYKENKIALIIKKYYIAPPIVFVIALGLLILRQRFRSKSGKGLDKS